MSFVRIHIVVEGQTEEAFIKDLLAPSFWEAGIQVDARLIGEAGHKGGFVRWQRLLRDLRILLLGDPSAYTTTFFDFFRMGTDFPGEPHKVEGNAAIKRLAVEGSIVRGLREAGISDDQLRRFVPYVQMHEFEGLLFSRPASLARGIYREDLTMSLQAVRDQFETPEHINDGANTAPSKRLKVICPGYRKPVYGLLAALEVGLPAMRKECPLFNDWLGKLESLRGSGSSV